MNHPIKVLHVDDDEQFTALTSQLLGRENERLETIAKTHAEEALDCLSDPTERIHCIVSDYALPDLDGIRLLETVRESHPNLPFIIFTGMGSETVARDALTSGATDYLQKRGGTEQYGLLAKRIRDAVEQHRTQQERAWSERSRWKLYEITSEPELGFEEKIDRLLNLGCERLGVENGYVARIDTSTDSYQFEHVVDTSLVQEGTEVDLQETFCRHALASDRPLAVYSAADEGYGEDPAYDRWGVSCYIGGRIDIGDELYGTVCFIDREPREQEFTEAERTFIELVSRWLSHTFERQKYEEELRQEKARFELLVREVSTHAIFMLDTDGRVVSWNAGARNIKGYENEEIIGQHFSTFYPEELVAERLPEWMLATAEKEGRVEHEGWRVRKDGSRFRAQVSITALYDDTGSLRGFGKVTRDLTERYERHQRFESLIEHSSDVITVLDEEGTVDYQSPSVKPVLGYRPDELIGEDVFEYVHPDDRESVLETFSELIGEPGRVTETVRYRFRHSDGSWVWLESIGSNQKAALLDGYVVNSRDVTGQIRRKHALEASQERFRSIAESATDAIVTIDAESTVHFANQAVERVFGIPPGEIEGKSLTTMMPERYRDRHRDALDRYLDTGNRQLDWTNVELPGLHRDGHEIDLQISFSEVEIGGERRFTGIIRT